MKAAEHIAGSCLETAPAAEHPENSRSLAPRLWRHGCLLLACVVLTLGVRATLKPQHAAERRRLELAARARRTAEIAALWNRLTYADLAAPGTTSRFLTAVDWRSLRLSTTQETRLRTRLAEVLAYLGQPTVAGYLRLKTEGLHPTFAPNPKVRRAPDPNATAPVRNTTVGEATRRGAAPSPAPNGEAGSTESRPTGLALPAMPANPERVVEGLWRSLATNRPPSRLTAVCLERIRVATTTTNTPFAVFTGPTAQGFTIAREAINPGFGYGPGPRGRPPGRVGPLLPGEFLRALGRLDQCRSGLSEPVLERGRSGLGAASVDFGRSAEPRHPVLICGVVCLAVSRP